MHSQRLYTYYKPAGMALLLNSLWVSQVNGGALCDKSLISTCNARAVQLTSTLISHELRPLLRFIKQINHTSQALIYLLLLFKCSERENTPYASHASSSCRLEDSMPQFKSLNSGACKELTWFTASRGFLAQHGDW